MKPDDASLMRGGARRVSVHRLRGGEASVASDWVADEVPVALEFNGLSHAVMLATPLDLADFALGFALSEGLLASASELYDLEEVPGANGITLQLEVASAAFTRLKDRRRTLAGRTGCGLCGTDSLAQVLRPMPALATRQAGDVIAPAAIARAMDELAALQALNQATGAVHAAAWCSREGEVRLLREDVGRHNALDKLIGALVKDAAHRGQAAQGFVAVTSRASFEMVQKTLCLGAPLLAAVSAPTVLAVQVAEQEGLSLVGFARRGDLVAYTHPDRLGL
jgi:FdhD protein